MIDFHAHIIPDIDDGAKDAQQSVDMLRVLFSQGIRKVVATPHFYAGQQTVESFCLLREEKLSVLKQAIEGLSEEELPKIAVGSEVLFFPTIYSFENLSSLCIKGTDYLVIEMPQMKWSQSIFDSIHRLISNRGIIPIIAHADRFIPYGNGVKELEKLKSLGAFIQINSDFFEGFFNRRKAVLFAKKNLIDVLGSDCHNMDERRPEIMNALSLLGESVGRSFIKKIEEKSEKILENAVIF